MKLNFEQVPPPDRRDFGATLLQYLRSIAQQLNRTTEGRIAAMHSAMTAAPSTGDYAIGDEVPNANRGVVLGVAGSRYTVRGWVCTSASPLTFAEQRCLTGT